MQAQNTTIATRVPTWHRQTSDALSRRDRRALRTLRASVAWSLAAMQGRELAEGRALLARIEAARRFLRGGRRGG